MRHEWICRDSQGTEWSYGETVIKHSFGKYYDVEIQHRRFGTLCGSWLMPFPSILDAAKYCEKIVDGQ